MVFDSFHIEEVRVWSPEELGGVCRHVEWYAGIMLEPRIIPPLAEENVHRVFLLVENTTIHYLER